MYVPAHFQSPDQAHALELIKRYPFATLISQDDQGFPAVSYLPLHLSPSQPSAALVLQGHLAHANPQVQFLRARPQALVSFMGPHAYLSPTVYPDAQRVPTWNYLAVQARVEVRFIDDLAQKDELLKALIADHEPAYAKQWRDLPLNYQTRMLSAIDAFELTVFDLQCKLKLNQHRPESHARTYEVYAQGDDHERALAQWMISLGLIQP